MRDSLHVLFISGQTEGEPLLITAQLTDGRKIVRMMPQGFQPDRRLGTLRAPFVIDTDADAVNSGSRAERAASIPFLANSTLIFSCRRVLLLLSTS